MFIHKTPRKQTTLTSQAHITFPNAVWCAHTPCRTSRCTDAVHIVSTPQGVPKTHRSELTHVETSSRTLSPNAESAPPPREEPAAFYSILTFRLLLSHIIMFY